VRGVPAQLHPARTVHGGDTQLHSVQIALARALWKNE
jgi:hypothetical protein